jgi:hypothetical protein
MRYNVFIYETEAQMAHRTDPVHSPAYWASYAAYFEAMAKAGVTAPGGSALKEPHTATSIRIENGTRQVQDGPFADTKEQLGGYFVLEVPDLDTAIDWAAKCPSGKVEVRPQLAM